MPALSKKQQKFMGIVRSIQKGEQPASKFSKAAQDVAKDMKKKDFIEGEFVDVSGISKGKGFQGVVKRHGFAGVGQSTHGQHNRLRAPGSIGAASYPSRVFKGMKMAGRTGGERIKMINLQVLKVIPEKNILIVKGSVPGSKGTYLIVEK